MMAFRFSLQPLLNWKRSLEDQSQMRLAGLMTRLKTQEERIEKLTLQRLASEQKLKEKSEQGIRAGEYLLFKQFAEASRKDLISQEDEKRRILREIDEERKKLLAITKEKKTLERLKEKQFKESLSLLEKAEQKRADEATTLKYQPRREEEIS
jgi:flagellar FliJ protein